MPYSGCSGEADSPAVFGQRSFPCLIFACMFTISTPSVAVYPQLLLLWEASVRATHHFLKEEDLLFYKSQLVTVYFPQVQLSVAHDDQGNLLGFSGTAGDHLEMLFISPDARGRGVGKLLLEHAIREQGITKVDVNEQNGQALGFYQHAGFKTSSRSEYDGQGKPYPILHMALAGNKNPDTL